MSDAAAVKRLERLVEQRVADWHERPLSALCGAQAELTPADAAIIAALVNERASLADWLAGARTSEGSPGAEFSDDPAGFLLEWLVRYFQSRNQFLEIDAGSRRELASIMREATATASRRLKSPAGDAELARALAAVWSELRGRLAAFLRARLGPAPRDVVAAEYSPELQLAVLGVELERLEQPVLDLGCGHDAKLVRYLREQGHDALGLDRDAPEEVALSGDWLSFDYGTARWGSILSHLGFSLYFWHHHLGKHSAAFDYAKVYMALLRGLRVGGSFCYAPALPFIEALLKPSIHSCERIPLAAELRGPALVAVEQATGMSLRHATHVTRVG